MSMMGRQQDAVSAMLAKTTVCADVVQECPSLHVFSYLFGLQVPKEDSPSIPPELMSRLNISAEVRVRAVVKPDEQCCEWNMSDQILQPDRFLFGQLLLLCSALAYWTICVLCNSYTCRRLTC